MLKMFSHSVDNKREKRQKKKWNKKLQEAWSTGKKEGLENLIKEKVTGEDKDIDDLIEILECHFDPEKKPPQPSEGEKKKLKKVKPEKKKKSSINNNLSGAESPDTTYYTPEKPKDEKENDVPVSVECRPHSAIEAI